MAIHGDMTLRAAADSAAMEWQTSPSGSVWRKRLHRVGAAESGQVTSIVRYQPGSSFPAHDHPEGEAILVLEGTFSDEHGDWGAGSYLLNPEGFRHAPFSREGCLIFVKLRQYAGAHRHHVALDTRRIPWKPGDRPGIEYKLLYQDERFPELMRLERWSAGAAPGPWLREGGVEILLLDGALEDERGRYEKGAWLRLPAGAIHEPRSPDGCELYVKAGAVASLQSEPEAD